MLLVILFVFLFCSMTYGLHDMWMVPFAVIFVDMRDFVGLIVYKGFIHNRV